MEYLDVVEHIRCSRIPSGRDTASKDAFLLQSFEEALGHGIVVTVLASSQARHHAVFFRNACHLLQLSWLPWSGCALTPGAGLRRHTAESKDGNLLMEFTPAQGQRVEYVYLGGKRIAQKVSP